MNAQQKRRAERLAAIVGYLKALGASMTAEEIHMELHAMNVGFSTVQEYLRDLVMSEQIHFIVTSRAGSNGAPKMHYAYGPSPSGVRSLSKPRHQDISAQCNWLKSNEWPRGQHGMDRMVTALFGGGRA